MNKDNAKDFLPLVEALAAGKTIQIKGSDGVDWFDMTDVMFGSYASDYRIKPDVKMGLYSVVLHKVKSKTYTTTVDHENRETCQEDLNVIKSSFSSFVKVLIECEEYEIPEETV